MISELLRGGPPCRVCGLVEERPSKKGAQCEEEGPGLLEAPAFFLPPFTERWGGGVPQAKVPSTEEWCVILFEPESHFRGSGSFALRGGGGS